MLMPWCLFSSRAVRQTSRMCDATWAPVIHVFWPLST